jgi:2-polyprenyl-3-methyl-5-hydroxy-6-metoxy-1,4-benzoquinol methylase
MSEGWNHNTHYHERLLDALPRPCSRVLDVGCGRGHFTRRLATIAAHVDALDSDAETIARARDASTAFPNITFIDRDFLTWQGSGYDAITMLATLHHLPIDAALTRAVSLLRPGGRLIVLGLDRAQSIGHLYAQALVAVPVSRYYRLTRRFVDVGAPLREPELTLAEIRTHTNGMLPGAVIRRHLLWRYSLVWSKPG